MADEAATARDKRFRLVSLLPDVCKTPGKKGKPIPYPITHAMDQSAQCSPNVFFRGQPAFLHNESYVDNVKGDEPGGGKGIVSKTHVKISHSIDKSRSVYVNGKPIVRTGDMMWMNYKKPGDDGGEAAGAAGTKAQTKAERWQCRQQQVAAGEAAWTRLTEPKFDWDVSQSYAHALALMYRDARRYPEGIALMNALFASGTVLDYEDRPRFVLGTIYYEKGDLENARHWLSEANRISKGRCFRDEPEKYRKAISK